MDVNIGPDGLEQRVAGYDVSRATDEHAEEVESLVREGDAGPVPRERSGRQVERER
jgi:hypothetical protein